MLSRPLFHHWKITSQPVSKQWLATPRALGLRQRLSLGSSGSYRHFSASFACRSVIAQTTTTPSNATSPPESNTSTTGVEEHKNSNDDVYGKLYVGPLGTTFRRLKIFSLSSLMLSTTLAPFIFVIESNLPPTARLVLASIAILTSATSTGLVAWVGKPYVTQLRYIRPEENGGAEGIEMTTMSLTMKPKITTVSGVRVWSIAGAWCRSFVSWGVLICLVSSFPGIWPKLFGWNEAWLC